MNRFDLQRLALMRIADADALLAAGQFSGAYYVAGYAVECALKAVIARKTQQYDFHDRKLVQASYTHRCADLITPAGLQPRS